MLPQRGGGWLGAPVLPKARQAFGYVVPAVVKGNALHNERFCAVPRDVNVDPQETAILKISEGQLVFQGQKIVVEYPSLHVAPLL